MKRYMTLAGEPLRGRAAVNLAVEDTMIRLDDRLPQWLVNALDGLHMFVERVACVHMGHTLMECGNVRCPTGRHCAYCGVRLPRDEGQDKEDAPW